MKVNKEILLSEINELKEVELIELTNENNEKQWNVSYMDIFGIGRIAIYDNKEDAMKRYRKEVKIVETV